LSCTTQEKLAQDDDELRGLSSFGATQKNKHKMMTNFLACCFFFAIQEKKPQDDNELSVHYCFLQLKKTVAQDDDEPKGSWLSCVTQEK